MFDRLEVTKQGGLKVNGALFQRQGGYNAKGVIERLMEQRCGYSTRYKEYLESIKDGQDVDSKAFDDIKAKIRVVDASVLSCADALQKNKQPIVEKRKAIFQGIQENRKAIVDIKTKQPGFHVIQKDVENIVSLAKRNEELFKELLRTPEPNTFVDEDSNNFTSPNPSTSPKPIKKGKKVAKKSSPVIEQTSEIKDRIKALLKETFSFKSRKDCMSRAKAMFMSKEQILEAIDNNADLKSVLPASYKKMSKETLCEYMFGP